jgi:hypothetical protein
LAERLDQRFRPQQAADVVGAGGLEFIRHCRSSTQFARSDEGAKFFDVKPRRSDNGTKGSRRQFFVIGNDDAAKWRRSVPQYNVAAVLTILNVAGPA